MNNNPFAAFQAQQPAQTFAQNPAQLAPAPAQPGNPFGAAPVQQQQQQPPQLQAQPPVNAGAFGQQQAQQPAAPGAGFSTGLPDFGDIGESGRNPGIPEGLSLLLFKANQVKTFTGHTAIADFTVITCTDTTHGPGSTLGFVKKLPTDKSKQKTAIGFALSMIRALAGYNDEATFKMQVPEWSQILAAFIHGDPKFGQWAAGRRVGVRGTRGEEIIENSGPNKGQRTGRFYVQLEWFPAPQQ